MPKHRTQLGGLGDCHGFDLPNLSEENRSERNSHGLGCIFDDPAKGVRFAPPWLLWELDNELRETKIGRGILV